MPEPFFTIATQNPIEQEGTYPLPEAQLDRFMFNIKVDYPTADEEERILAVDHAQREGRSAQGALGRAIVNLQKLVELGGGERVHREVRRAAGAGHAAQATRRRPSSCGNWSTGAPARGPGSS